MPQLELPNLNKCDRCPLSGGRAVPPTGPTGADILVVGEAPGVNEVGAGMPFMGVTGKILRRLLQRADLHSRCVFTNTVLHRPPKNRDPLPEELEACRYWLEITTEIVQPKAIICVGRFSARWAGFKGAIGKHHGKVVRKGSILHGVVYHPSYLYRLSKDRNARERYRDVEASTLRCFQEIHERIDSISNVPDYRPALATAVQPGRGAPYFVDIEGYGPTDGRYATPVVMSLRQGQTNYVFPFPDSTILSEYGDRPAGHNIGMYDLPILLRHGMPRPDTVDDTMVLAAMQTERHLALKDLVRTRLGIETMTYEEATEQGGWATWMNYSAQDVELTDRLLEFLRHRMGSERWLYENVESRLIPILSAACLKGFHVDPAKALELNASMEAKLRLIEKKLYHYYEFPTPSPTATTGDMKMGPEQVKAAVKEVLGVRLRDTEEETLKALYARTKHPLVGLVLARRKAAYVISHYTRALVEAEVISTMLDTIGAEGGRMASRDPNLQNWPAYLRGALCAPPGFKLVMGDYSQIELRIAAYISGDRRMINDFRDELNLHEQLCKDVYGYVTPELYTRAKSANFERLFGGKEYKLAEMLGVPLPEAKRLIDAHERRYPDYAAWCARQIMNARRDKEVRTLLGRRRALWDFDSEDPKLRSKAEREAINTPIQGTNADFTKYGMCLADEPMRQLGGYVLHQTHDSIDCVIPDTIKDEEGAEALRIAMLTAIPAEFKKVVPVEVKVEVGTHWK